MTSLDATGMKPAGLRVDSLRVAYGETTVLPSLCFHVGGGETFVVLGESGCGKTTLLRAVAGLIDCSAQSIRLDDVEISALTPAGRRVVYLDQEPLLFEHLTVVENLAFAMRLQRQPAETIGLAVERLLVELDLVGHAEKREW